MGGRGGWLHLSPQGAIHRRGQRRTFAGREGEPVSLSDSRYQPCRVWVSAEDRVVRGKWFAGAGYCHPALAFIVSGKRRAGGGDLGGGNLEHLLRLSLGLRMLREGGDVHPGRWCRGPRRCARNRSFLPNGT